MTTKPTAHLASVPASGRRSMFRTLFLTLAAAFALLCAGPSSQAQAGSVTHIQSVSPMMLHVGPNGNWQFGGDYGHGLIIVRANWGSGRRRRDVTRRVIELSDREFRADTDNLGDPAEGSVKTLIVTARDDRGRTRDYTFREHDIVPRGMFRR